MTFYMGIDPGNSGAIAILADKKLLETFRFKDKTGAETKDWVKSFVTTIEQTGGELVAAIENVHSMPRQGVASSFKFGKHFGHCLGILDALEVTYQLVTPQKWQKQLGCMSKGDKNVTKARAHREFPKFKSTHADADAILIALWLARFGQ